MSKKFSNIHIIFVGDSPMLGEVKKLSVESRDENSLTSAVLKTIGDPAWLSKSKTAALNLVNSGFNLNRTAGKYISLHEKLSSDAK